MDWIEQVFHVDPDRGSGIVELSLLLLLAVALVIGVRRLTAGKAPARLPRGRRERN